MPCTPLLGRPARCQTYQRIRESHLGKGFFDIYFFFTMHWNLTVRPLRIRRNPKGLDSLPAKFQGLFVSFPIFSNHIHQAFSFKNEVLSFMNPWRTHLGTTARSAKYDYISTCSVVSQICCRWRRFEKEILVHYFRSIKMSSTETVHKGLRTFFVFFDGRFLWQKKRDVSTIPWLPKIPCASRMCTLSNASFAKWRRLKWLWIRRNWDGHQKTAGTTRSRCT